MARSSFSFFYLTIWTLFFTLLVNSQTISTDTAVPPLQWINLSGLLRGSSSPPPLKNAAIGYDETSRSVIIFGGESASGLVQSQTFLLNLDTLTWSVPTPPSNLLRTPPARTAVVAGGDFAPSNRQGFVVIGGKGFDGTGLTDVWEYDFNNQFWSEVNVAPGGPLPRWGASGGIDITTAPVQDPVVPGPNNTFYLIGGYNGLQSNSFSDVWRLNISGTLSSNLPNDSEGSWDHLSIGHLPSKTNQTGTVVNHQVILTGGCDSHMPIGLCADQDSYLIDTQRLSEASPAVCPAPRKSPVLVRNVNRFTSTFSSQVYLLLGLLDKTRWKDDNGLENGEVAILDTQTGTWSRVIPSGDPGSGVSEKPMFPTPREGAAAFSYPMALVGRSRNSSSDTIIFGGQDSSGNTLSDVWLLRAYNGITTSSQPTWPGFGNGHLQTGINANGAGVRVKFMTQCASAITPSYSSTTSHPTAISSGIPTPPLIVLPFSTSVVHKVLAPVSLVIFQASFLLFRMASPLYKSKIPNVRNVYGSGVLALVAYGLGITGLVTSFTSISISSSSATMGHLQTGHGISSLIFFLLLYVVVPTLLLLNACTSPPRASLQDSESEKSDPAQVASPVAEETYEWPSSRSAPHSLHRAPSSPSSPRHRTNSWGPSSMMYRSQEERPSSDSESARSPSPKRGFEVVNRPSRMNKASGSWLAVPFAGGTSDRLRDIDWLQRRRSLNAVGELDYALTQVRREQMSSTPATADRLVATTTPYPSQPRLDFSPTYEIFLHVIVQVAFFGISIVTLIVLWSHSPKAGFAIFLAWTVIFYTIMISFSWHIRPDRSILSVIRSRRAHREGGPAHIATHSPPVSEALPGPYIHHQPPYHVAAVPDDVSISQTGPRSAETDEQDEDMDDDTRQRMIEDEIGRRDVSIVTIPKRKLWIVNP